jgi:hypothetical protein
MLRFGSNLYNEVVDEFRLTDSFTVTNEAQLPCFIGQA